MISIIFPVYNEEKNLEKLFKELVLVSQNIKDDVEFVAVDDGSRDGSLAVLKRLAEEDNRLKIIMFTRNFGQTAALSAGITHSTGDVVVTIDSDLENDPSDIPKLLSLMQEGFDVVSGWRQHRWRKKWITRKLPSLLANEIISRIAGLKLHDYGCTLKAYRRSIVGGIGLYGEMHRFIPAYAFWQGAKVTEVPVHYRERTHGISNYGVGRTYRVILDLLLIKFLTRYLNRPMHFFGGIGFVSLLLGGIAGSVAIYFRLTGQHTFVSTPLPILSALLVIVGVQLVVMGVLAEIMMRTYYESQRKAPYQIAHIIHDQRSHH